MDNNINNTYEIPTNTLEAYHMARRVYDAENQKLPEKYDYLAGIILNDSELDYPGILVWWGKTIKTHIDEMFDKLLQFYDVAAYSEWCMEVNYYRNDELKFKAIKNNDVDEWLNFINSYYFDNNYLYTREKFYDNLPKEYQLGIII